MPTHYNLPTLATLTAWIQTLLPHNPADVQFLYHIPRHRHFDPARTPVRKLLLSITPTQGVYNALHATSGNTVAFLHRPWSLDRARVPRRAVVLASHKVFDERLTVGCNEFLAARLGVQTALGGMLVGYKGDVDRRIGIFGPVDAGVDEMLARIWGEFGAWEGVFGVGDGDDDGLSAGGEGLSAGGKRVKVLAIMNAFHAEEVERVAVSALQAGLISSVDECSEVMYLTGAVREPGLVAALAKGMKVVCVGHKVCEQWGIRFLTESVRRDFPGLEVEEIDEPEEPRAPRIVENAS